MGSRWDGGDEPRTPGSDDFDTRAYVDAADRLERTMDAQIQILGGIDSKAEHITRLIALLLGVLFSVLSFVTQLPRLSFSPPPYSVLGPFGIGVGSLLVSMAAAIITYLSSQHQIGLHEDVGEVLSDASYFTDLPEHIRNVLGTYSFVIDRNRSVIEANVFWFRLTSLFLFNGLLFISTSGFLYLGRFQRPTPRIVLLLASAVSVGVGYFVLSGSFLPQYDESGYDE